MGGSEDDDFGVDERRKFFLRIDKLNTELENARRLEKASWEKNKRISAQISMMVLRLTGLDRALQRLPQGEELIQEFVVPLQHDMTMLARQTSRSPLVDLNTPCTTPKVPAYAREQTISSPSTDDPESDPSPERKLSSLPKLYSISSEASIMDLYMEDTPEKAVSSNPIRTSDPEAPDVWIGLDAASWTNRERCDVCQCRFYPFHRWHHCRKCARCVCSKCSPFRVSLKPMNIPTGAVLPGIEVLPDGSPRAHRICQLCHSRLPSNSRGASNEH